MILTIAIQIESDKTQDLQVSTIRHQNLNAIRRRQSLNLAKQTKPLGGLAYIEESDSCQEDTQENRFRVVDYFTNQEVRD